MASVNVPDRMNELTAGAVGSVDAATEAEIGPYRKSRWKAMAAGGRRLPDLGGIRQCRWGEAASEKGDSCGRVSRPCGNRTWAGRPRRRRRHKNGTPMTTSPSPRPPLPPFDRDAAIRKVRLAEDAWNTSFGRPVHRVRDDFRRAGPRRACRER